MEFLPTSLTTVIVGSDESCGLGHAPPSSLPRGLSALYFGKRASIVVCCGVFIDHFTYGRCNVLVTEYHGSADDRAYSWNADYAFLVHEEIDLKLSHGDDVLGRRAHEAFTTALRPQFMLSN